MMPIERECSSSRRGWRAQSSIRRRGECGDAAHAEIPGAGTDAERAAGAEPGEPHSVDALLAEQVVGRGQEVRSHPAIEKSPADPPVPRKLTDSATQPISLAMRSARSGCVRWRARRDRARRGSPMR